MPNGTPFENSGFDESRRAFLKKAVAAAFVTPAVASFALDALTRPTEAAPTPTICPNQSFPNQSFPSAFPTPTQTINTNKPGSVSISSGAVLITGVTIGGSVIVTNGASVWLHNCIVNGSVTATGANVVWIDGTTVNGTVSVTRSSGFVLLGAAGVSGANGNTFKNGVTLNYNTGGIRMEGNTVTGSVGLAYNVSNCGPDPISQNSAGTVVNGNTISGNLSGNYDQPPATGTNTVAGTKSGEF